MADSLQNLLMGHINELYKRFQESSASLEALQQKLPLVDQIAPLSDEISSLKKILKEITSAYGSIQKAIDLSNQGMSKQIEDVKGSVKEAVSKADVLKKDQEATLSDHAVKQKRSEESLNVYISNIRQELKDAIREIQDKYLASPASVIESNQALVQKIEASRIDASNVNLKLSNFDSQMILFQRKLENLEIRIKKMELGAAT